MKLDLKTVSMIVSSVICTFIIRGGVVSKTISGGTGIALIMGCGVVIGILHAVFWPEAVANDRNPEGPGKQ